MNEMPQEDVPWIALTFTVKDLLRRSLVSSYLTRIYSVKLNLVSHSLFLTVTSRFVD